jgi:hypothetical protein
LSLLYYLVRCFASTIYMPILTLSIEESLGSS